MCNVSVALWHCDLLQTMLPDDFTKRESRDQLSPSSTSFSLLHERTAVLLAIRGRVRKLRFYSSVIHKLFRGFSAELLLRLQSPMLIPYSFILDSLLCPAVGISVRTVSACIVMVPFN